MKSKTLTFKKAHIVFDVEVYDDGDVHFELENDRGYYHQLVSILLDAEEVQKIVQMIAFMPFGIGNPEALGELLEILKKSQEYTATNYQHDIGVALKALDIQE